MLLDPVLSLREVMNLILNLAASSERGMGQLYAAWCSHVPCEDVPLLTDCSTMADGRTPHSPVGLCSTL